MIPSYQEIMLPLLQELADGKEHTSKDLYKVLADRFGLTEEERTQLMSNGRQPLFHNRVGWAQTYLKKAGLLETPKRGSYHITNRGLEVLSQKPASITVDYLMRFPEFVEFRSGNSDGDTRGPDNPGGLSLQTKEESTPEELLELGYRRMRQSLADELLARIKSCSPEFFERLVVDLLVQMGYGGSQSDAGKAIGRSGDGGIDGIIKEDRLGLDIIYIQAKRWEGSVGRPEIQKFVGALQGQRARKGVFLTTASFTKEAIEYTGMIDTKVVLVDGNELAQLMIDHGVGVTPLVTYEIKKIDQDYFMDE
ncbi:restriction endonuclease [Effusibacillus pohliae]|uniref:restriction endonuclease n=1 Tax=Effusibacillus pohliae TaxID=232270 RepID=UPI00036DD0D4|nr:restriction endonuclease [Effusibacillus pohliae]